MTLEIVRALGLITVQHLGSRGRMHEAIPPGGALVPDLLAAANRAVGNDDGAPGLEILGQLVVRALAPQRVSIDGDPRSLHAGEELAVTSEPRRCTYLAISGGIAAPEVALCAQLVTPLRTGDRIRSGTATGIAFPCEPFLDTDTIAILPGPDLDAFGADAIPLLTSAPYRILPSSNRVGTRLDGPALPRNPAYRERSRPMVQGALEVPRDGQPIVLGPDHPTTGGYPILAVVTTADLGRFHAIRLGGSVRFTSSR